MSLFVVTEKASGSEVTRYVAIAATESVGYSFADFDHAETPDAPEQPVVVDPALWRIDVGSFFDRFGDAKLAILASENTIVKAMITDASVRKYISLIEREAKLRKALAAAQSATRGLRDDLATLRTRLPNTIPSACIATADALAGLLDQCQQEYRVMGEIADGHASDVQTLMEAWPK